MVARSRLATCIRPDALRVVQCLRLRARYNVLREHQSQSRTQQQYSGLVQHRCGSSSTAQYGLKKVLTRFDNVSIYNAGTGRTVFMGFTRIATIALFLFGSLVVEPALYSDPTVPNTWVVVAVAGSTIPFIATMIATAPYVSNVRIALPRYVERSSMAIKKFAKQLPPDTKLVLQTMRIAPWPSHQEVRFDQLRRLDGGSKHKSSNLEVISADPSLNWISRRLFYSFHINRSQAKDKSALPGVMDEIWKQIPLKSDRIPKAPYSAPSARSSHPSSTAYRIRKEPSAPTTRSLHPSVTSNRPREVQQLGSKSKPQPTR